MNIPEFIDKYKVCPICSIALDHNKFIHNMNSSHNIYYCYDNISSIGVSHDHLALLYDSYFLQIQLRINKDWLFLCLDNNRNTLSLQFQKNKIMQIPLQKLDQYMFNLNKEYEKLLLLQ